MPEPLDDAVRRRFERQQRRDTKPERALRRELHRRGFRYRVDFRAVPAVRSRADIAFTRQKVAVFVDGGFWRCCPEHGTLPKNNREWWEAKLRANVERDRRTDAAYREAGWRVLRVWEHAGCSDAADTVEEAVRRSAAKSTSSI